MIGTCLIALVAGGTVVNSQEWDERRQRDEALYESLTITADELRPAAARTEIVVDGEPRAVICHADSPAWFEAATAAQEAVRDATGVELPMVTDQELGEDDRNVILLGTLDNNSVVARLYHNYYVCLDAGYTGRNGYVLRSVIDPWGDGRDTILVGGSHAESTARAAEVFGDIVAREAARAAEELGEIVAGEAERDALELPRLMELEFDAQDRVEPARGPVKPEERDSAIARGREYFASAGRGRNGTSQLVRWGVRYHRTGDPLALEAYRELMLAMLEYYATDETINEQGMRRYDNDFRDASTFTVAITWDLVEESGAFTDQERLDITNLMIRLALECELYQGWDRPDSYEKWSANEDIVHNHNTFPALGAYFLGNYMLRHYGLAHAEKWLTVAHGIFNGQKHVSKPLEDAAAYQWLPIIHTMIYSLAEGDTTFFDEGHAREAAQVAMMVMDNAGYQSAFGDHSAYKASSGISQMLKPIAWHYKDPEILWMAGHAAVEGSYLLGQRYNADFEPEPPTSHAGVTVSKLPKLCYDYAARSPQYPTAPNVPWEATFDKIALRGGIERDDEYLLLDGFGRGTHMHFDTNAIIRYAAGGEPLLVDGEYIKNAPKYHNSMVIIRDGRAELTPTVARLVEAKGDGGTAHTRSTIEDYNGADWTREILWVRGEYFVVSDLITAREAGDYTLRCCWRPWGDTSLDGSVLTVDHKPMRMQIVNADGASCRVEKLKTSEMMPISRLSQQVSVRLEAGEEYRFVNLVHAEAEGDAVDVSIAPVGDGTYVVTGAGGAQVVTLGDKADIKDVGGGIAVARVPVVAPREDKEGPPSMERSWDFTGFEAAPALLRVERVTSNEPHSGRYGPVGKLVDGEFSSSMSSVMWPAGVTPTIVAELPEEAEISSVVLREWHMNEGWDVGDRRLQISSDGFDQDVRGIDAPFEEAGTQSWGGNTNSMYEVKIGQRARQIRLTVSPARDDSNVYIAELQIHGTGEGVMPEIRAVATGDLTGDGVDEIVACSDSGEVVALTAAGEMLWSYRQTERAMLNALACGDVDGDGKAEVMFGGNGSRLGLLSSDGELLWTAEPPKFRGIAADVMCIVAADVDGDGNAEVVCGCKNWMYFAYDADGSMIWENVIYAHSATVTCADDFDGDGLPEIIGGNAYYTLNIIDHDGERIYNGGRFGPEQTAVGSADVDGDGVPEILVGTDGGELICFDGDGTKLWETNVGDKVTRILSVDGRIVVAAESAHVFALDVDGSLLWRTPLPGGASDACVVDDSSILVTAGSAGVLRVDAAGQVVAAARTSDAAKAVVLAGDTAVVTTSGGAAEGFAIR